MNMPNKRKGILKRSILKELGLFIGYDTYDNKKVLLLEIDDPGMIHDSDFPKRCRRHKFSFQEGS